MLKPSLAPHFAARSGINVAGERHVLQAPDPVTTNPAPTASPALIQGTKDEIAALIRAEVGKVTVNGKVVDLGEFLAGERTANLEKIAKLDELVKKLDTDFARAYQQAAANPFGGKDGLAEREYIMRPHESVEGFLERHDVGSGRVMFHGSGGSRASGGMRMGGGHGRGLAGVKDQRGISAARSWRALAAASRQLGFKGGDAPYKEAADIALKRWGDKSIADGLAETAELVTKLGGTVEEREHSERSLGTSTVGSGAGLVKPDFANFLMDYLFAKIIMMDLGAMTLPMKNELSFPFIDVAITAQFRAEATGPNAGQPGDNYAQFLRKIITAICAVTNEWLNEADYGPDVFIRNHLMRAIAVLADLRMFRGRGTANELRGADYWVENAGTSHYFNRTRDAGSGKATFKTINHDLLDMMRIVSGENIDLQSGRPGYALPNEVFYALMRVLSGTALELRPYADELRAGSLNGAPVKVTTQFPTNLAGDGVGDGTGNKTNVYFGEWSTFAVAQNGGIEVKAMDGAAYKDVNGTTQPGFTNNETVIRADWKLDTAALQRGKELARADSVDWHVTF